MKRLLKYIFIPIFAVLLMSHNTYADIDASMNIHPIWANANPLCSFHHYSSNTWANNSFSNQATSNVTASVDKINCDYPNQLATFKTIAVYSFRFDNYAYDNSADSGWLSSRVRAVTGGANWGVIGQEVSSMASTGYQVDIYLYGQASDNTGGTFQIYNPLNEEEIFYIKPQERITFIGASYWALDKDLDYTTILNSISSKLDTLNNTQNEILSRMRYIREYTNSINSNIISIDGKLDDINEGLNESNEHFQKEEQAADNISNQSPSNIGNSGNAATTNLVGALSGFITTIANAPATNCLINGDLGNLDIGSIDLCQGKENFNTLVEFIGFTALFGVVFWASYHLIKKTLALIDWARSK